MAAGLRPLAAHPRGPAGPAASATSARPPSQCQVAAAPGLAALAALSLAVTPRWTLVTPWQQQPCIVRELIAGQKYELIAGERRWRAAKLLNQDLKVIISTLTDSEAALVQAAENNNRLNLSDYAKGQSYASLIKNGVLKQKDLITTIKSRFNKKTREKNRITF